MVSERSLAVLRAIVQDYVASREPVGSWVGVRSECVVQEVGAGFNAADLFDAAGRFGRAASALVVERRPS